MPETTFHTTFSTSLFWLLRAKNGSESGLRSAVSYRFGFNGKENDNEVKGTGNSVDFGARIYDSRLGRWFSVDPLQAKYPDLSPYQFTGNNPITFIDYDGKDFGVKINHTTHTIVIVANVYTTDSKSYEQAQRAAAQWNAVSETIDGYTVTFQIKVQTPVSVSDEEVIKYDPSVVRKNGKYRTLRFEQARSKIAASKAYGQAMSDPLGIGNVYAGNKGIFSTNVTGSTYTGGVTANGEYVCMNTHDEKGDMGNFSDLVTHEFGHLFGLGDVGEKYFSKGGIMEYSGLYLYNISKNDVKNILNYAKDYLGGRTDMGEAPANVIILENTGESGDDENPIGVVGEIDD